ncbi:MAG: hypothetical protein IKW91_05750 [Bacteroidaceae bacterium]|nr:hypothetical protein [Bacteroidaceae bacterium]
MKKKHFNFIDLSGEAMFSDNGAPKVFTFHPEFPEPGLFSRYHRRGTATRFSDGTFEFVEDYWTRSRAQLIKKLKHGRLSKTLNGDYLLTLRLHEGENCPGRIIYEEAMEATDALLEYIYGEEEAAA